MEKNIFEDTIHKLAIKFRNNKRKEYLSEKLDKYNKSFVEFWDIQKVNDTYLWKMRNLKEEPLSLDIFIKFSMGKTNGRN